MEFMAKGRSLKEEMEEAYKAKSNKNWASSILERELCKGKIEVVELVKMLVDIFLHIENRMCDESMVKTVCKEMSCKQKILEERINKLERHTKEVIRSNKEVKFRQFINNHNQSKETPEIELAIKNLQHELHNILDDVKYLSKKYEALEKSFTILRNYNPIKRQRENVIPNKRISEVEALKENLSLLEQQNTKPGKLKRSMSILDSNPRHTRSPLSNSREELPRYLLRKYNQLDKDQAYGLSSFDADHSFLEINHPRVRESVNTSMEIPRAYKPSKELMGILKNRGIKL